MTARRFFSTQLALALALTLSNEASAQAPPPYGKAATPAERRELENEIARLGKSSGLGSPIVRAIIKVLRTTRKINSEQELIDILRDEVIKAQELASENRLLRTKIAKMESSNARAQASSFLQLGERAFREGKLSEARAAFKSVGDLSELEFGDFQAIFIRSRMAEKKSADLEGKYIDAAAIMNKAEQHPGISIETKFDFSMGQVDSLYMDGDLNGNASSLFAAIRHLETSSLPLAQKIGVSKNWTNAQTALGRALLIVGNRSSNPEAVNKAVAAFRAAGREYERQNDLSNVVIANNNLAVALIVLSHLKDDIRLLEEANTALDIAESRERILSNGSQPAQITTTEINRTIVRSSQAFSKSDQSGVEEAIAGYRATISKLSQKQNARDWARAHQNLGTALYRRGAFLNSVAVLEEAVSAHRTSQIIFNRKSYPLEWAESQSRLGKVLVKIAELKQSVPLTLEAQSVLRLSLTELTRERDPTGWTSANEDLAYAILSLRSNATQEKINLDEAVSIYRRNLDYWKPEGNQTTWARNQRALAELQIRKWGSFGSTSDLSIAIKLFDELRQHSLRDKLPLQWAAANFSWATATSSLGIREKDDVALQSAIAAYRDILTVWISENDSWSRGILQINLGNTLIASGQARADSKLIEEAILAYEAAITTMTRDKAPHQWAGAENGLGYAQLLLAEIRKDEALYTSAEQHFLSALNVFAIDKFQGDFAKTQFNLSWLLLNLGEFKSDGEKLSRAIERGREALKVWTVENNPQAWGDANAVIAQSAGRIANLAKDEKASELAVTSWKKALSVEPADGDRALWAGRRVSYGSALIAHGTLLDSKPHVLEGLDILSKALTDSGDTLSPSVKGALYYNSGDARRWLWVLEGDHDMVDLSVADYKNSLLSWQTANDPIQIALVQLELAYAEASHSWSIVDKPAFRYAERSAKAAKKYLAKFGSKNAAARAEYVLYEIEVFRKDWDETPDNGHRQNANGGHA
jgi:tetratricopeptide (TPR) repeat protein